MLFQSYLYYNIFLQLAQKNILYYGKLTNILYQNYFRVLFQNLSLFSQLLKQDCKQLLISPSYNQILLRKNSALTKTFIEPIKRDDIYSAKSRLPLKKTTVFIKYVDYMKGKLIVVYKPALEVVKKEIN